MWFLCVVSEKESSTTYFSLCFWNFCCSYFKAFSWKDLWRSLVVSLDIEPCILIKKWFRQGQFVLIFGDEIIPAKSLQWIPFLAASNNISINKLVHRRYPLVHCEKYSLRNTYLRSSILQKNILPKHFSALKAKLFFKKVSENC